MAGQETIRCFIKQSLTSGQAGGIVSPSVGQLAFMTII